jgi:hypothetical protein
MPPAGQGFAPPELHGETGPSDMGPVGAPSRVILAGDGFLCCPRTRRLAQPGTSLQEAPGKASTTKD